MKKNLSLLSFSLLLLAACSNDDKKKMDNSKEINITFESKSNSMVSGTASFKENNGTVSFTANVKGLKPGVHAIHIHEKSDCTAADGSSAGGHWNPTFKNHGKFGIGQYHRGDIGNFTADQYGNGSISITTKEWCIGCEDETKNILNKGLIIHQGADDFISQPTGDSGARVACSSIIK
jgi:Cu-Zn family superoxide dismutase